MNDEIKEINIKIPGQILDYVDTKEHLLDLFNYITNLQTIEKLYDNKLSENKLLKQELTNLQQEKEDYKSRCEKAIDMLKELNECIKDMLDIGIDIKNISDIEDVLQNGSDSQ